MSGFDIAAYFAALDGERERRELTWAAVTRELNEPFAHRRDIPPIATSTLGRTPEDFTPGHPVAGRPLPALAPGHLSRWDSRALFEVIDAKRVDTGASWASLVREVGGYSASSLKNIGRGVGFRSVMSLLAGLERPAADFVVNVQV